MEKKIVTTSDGSHSLFIPELDEYYHSTHGAIQESRYVFLEKGLSVVQEKKEEIKIFEVGFGTGLNAFLTWQALADTKHLHFHTIEAFPVDAETVNSLNYIPLLTGEKSHSVFDLMHACPWNADVEIDPRFTLHKTHGTMQETTLQQEYDLIYFDAFAPRAQADMWVPEILEKVVNAMLPGGVFVTYCAKGQVRRDLQAAGLEMERLPGPPGKREMLRGVKK